MTYVTTKVHSLKSYPTYQFCAAADPGTAGTDGVFKICILEAMRWIRSRLSDQTGLPPEFDTPDPQDYKSFSDDRISSFSYESGFQIEVVYIEELGVWSFRISEPDMGANIGTPQERAPVYGRSFATEIAFRKQSNCVEIGIKTVCSEPSDNRTDCEVFRPRVVKALAENPDIKLLHSGLIINGEPLRITSKAELERFIGIFEDPERSLPLIILADTAAEVRIPSAEDIPSGLPSAGFSAYRLSDRAVSPEQQLSIAPELLPYKAGAKLEKVIKKQKVKSPGRPVKEPAAEKLPMLDCEALASKLLGYAIVVFAGESFFKQIENKTRISLRHGDVVTVQGQQVTDRLAYAKYSRNMQAAFSELYAAGVEMPKRSAFNYGEVLFCSEAKQKEYHSKRKKTSSLEERCELYRLERDDLNRQVSELKQQQTDMTQTAAGFRTLRKKVELLERELEDKAAECERLEKEMSSKEDAYRRSSELIQFYKDRYELAADYPSDSGDVCKWIENSFPEEIIVAPRAVSEMRKYSGALDIFSLCDGIAYLAEYARYRQQKLSADELELFAEYGGWDIQGCGKEALKMFRTEYTVTVGGKQYILDQHIKHGNKSKDLIRIYFCWDAELGKIIIGSMPEHLATVRNAT